MSEKSSVPQAAGFVSWGAEEGQGKRNATEAVNRSGETVDLEGVDAVQGRQPPKTGARSASLGTGWSQVYFQHGCS